MFIAHYRNTLTNNEGIKCCITKQRLAKWILEHSYCCVITKIDIKGINEF